MTTENGTNGWKFSNDYGSVFFPAAGFNSGTDAGNEGVYWSGESYDDGKPCFLGISDGLADVRAYDVDVDLEFSVRLVRGL